MRVGQGNKSEENGEMVVSLCGYYTHKRRKEEISHYVVLLFSPLELTIHSLLN